MSSSICNDSVGTSDLLTMINDLQADNLKILEIINKLNTKVKSLEKKVCSLESNGCHSSSDSCDSDSCNDVELNIGVKLDELSCHVNERFKQIEKAIGNLSRRKITK